MPWELYDRIAHCMASAVLIKHFVTVYTDRVSTSKNQRVMYTDRVSNFGFGPKRKLVNYLANP
jgi:hypothetical protein